MEGDRLLDRLERLQGEGRCLNCEGPVSGAFCSACGQSVSTGRFNLRALSADIINSLSELNTPLLRTAWQLTVAPGRFTRGYLEGRRSPYMSPLKYALLLITVETFVGLLTGVDPFPIPDGAPTWLGAVLRLAVLATALSMGWALRATFPGTGLSYAEHAILPLYTMSHGTMIGAFGGGVVVLFGALTGLWPDLINPLAESLGVAWILLMFIAAPTFYGRSWKSAGWRLVGAYVLSMLPIAVGLLIMLLALLPYVGSGG